MWVLAVLLALAVALGWRYRGDLMDGHAVDAKEAAASPAVNAEAEPKNDTSRRGEAEAAGRVQSGAAPRHDPAYFLAPREGTNFRNWPEVEPLQLPPAPEAKQYPGLLEARTPDEAVWLDQHGYPTDAELKALDHTSELELAQRAADGDVTSMALLGEKQLREGKVVEGYNNLGEAALLGSIWAVLQLGDAQKRAQNLSDAFALYNLAAMLGDWESPAVHLQTGMQTKMASTWYMFVPHQTASLFANMQRMRQLRGLPPITPSARPNIFNRPSGSGEIGVYPRRR